MKILLDPVYSTYPSRCSSAAKCGALITYMQEHADEEVFFYWMYPAWLDDKEEPHFQREWDWFSQFKNVTLIPVPMYKDRMREYTKFTKEMDEVFAFNGKYWDIDGVFTSRTSMTPLMRAVMASPRGKKAARFIKTVVTFEEMILMSFRPTVALSDVEAQEMLTAMGYMASDKVLLVTEAEKEQCINACRPYLGPASIRKLREKIVLGSQVMFDCNQLQLKEEQYRYAKNRPFCLAFTGRLESSASNLEFMYKVFDNHYSWRGQNMKVLVTTVTPVTMFAPPDYVEVRHPNQQEFWKAIKEEMDLVVALHNNVEWSLSIFEPMLLGTPVILHDQRWARDILGDDYPFYAKGMTEVYGWIREWSENFDETFAIWQEYFETKLKWMFMPGGKYGISMYEVVKDHFVDFTEEQQLYVAENFKTKIGEDSIPRKLHEFVKDRQEWNLFDVIKEMGGLPILQSKLKDDDREERRITFSTDWNEMRMLFKHFFGWKDASGVGSFKK